MRHVSDDEAGDYRQQEGEEKMRRRLEALGRFRGGPDAPDPCGECDGGGFTHETFPPSECSRCLGTGVQP